MTTLIALGHGPDKNKKFDPGATGNGTTEAEFLRGSFLSSLKKYAKGHPIEFYEQNLYANRAADSIKIYDDVVELHLDAASPSAKGGHVIIYGNYKPDAMDQRLGEVIKNHFGLRGGKMFHGRTDLYNLNVFTKRKISYRLLELGFITNKENMDHFKKNVDRIAKELIEAIINKPIVTASQVKKTIEPDKKYHKVQVGAFSNKENADRLAEELRKDGYASYVVYN